METEFEKLTNAIWALKPKDKHYAWVVTKITEDSPLITNNILQKQKEGWNLVDVIQYQKILESFGILYPAAVSFAGFVLMECSIELYEQYIRMEEAKAAVQLAIAMEYVKEEGKESKYIKPEEYTKPIEAFSDKDQALIKNIQDMIENPTHINTYNYYFNFELNIEEQKITISHYKKGDYLEPLLICSVDELRANTTNIICGIINMVNPKYTDIKYMVNSIIEGISSLNVLEEDNDQSIKAIY